MLGEAIRFGIASEGYHPRYPWSEGSRIVAGCAAPRLLAPGAALLLLVLVGAAAASPAAALLRAEVVGEAPADREIPVVAHVAGAEHVGRVGVQREVLGQVDVEPAAESSREAAPVPV